MYVAILSKPLWYREWHIRITRYIHVHVIQDYNYFRCIAEMCVHLRALLHAVPVIRGVPSPDHCWGTGFGPFKLPTCTLLPGRRDHSQKAESGRASFLVCSMDMLLLV